jgi:hypothetical protein
VLCRNCMPSPAHPYRACGNSRRAWLRHRKQAHIGPRPHDRAPMPLPSPAVASVQACAPTCHRKPATPWCAVLCRSCPMPFRPIAREALGRFLAQHFPSLNLPRKTANHSLTREINSLSLSLDAEHIYARNAESGAFALQRRPDPAPQHRLNDRTAPECRSERRTPWPGSLSCSPLTPSLLACPAGLCCGRRSRRPHSGIDRAHRVDRRYPCGRREIRWFADPPSPRGCSAPSHRRYAGMVAEETSGYVLTERRRIQFRPGSHPVRSGSSQGNGISMSSSGMLTSSSNLEI